MPFRTKQMFGFVATHKNEISSFHLWHLQGASEKKSICEKGSLMISGTPKPIIKYTVSQNWWLIVGSCPKFIQIENPENLDSLSVRASMSNPIPSQVMMMVSL